MGDIVLGTWVSALIQSAKLRGGAPDSGWRPGKKLKLLIAGYNGAKNTGEEVRVEEIARQFRRILGQDNVQLSVLTLNPQFSEGYYGDADQVHLPFVFPRFLSREVTKYDGVVASCGAMFVSKFSNVPSIMMIEALAIASAQGKLSVAYGGEAGGMDSILAHMCRRYCADTSMIVRNEESAAALQKLGIPSHVGADTAWTFEPLSLDFGRKLLKSAGWDGVRPILAVCPNNPFWWPVKPSVSKTVAWAVAGRYRESHYQSIYFHHSGKRAEEAYQRYVDGLARAIGVFRKRRSVFPILVAMEPLDEKPCQRIAQQLGGIPIFSSEQFNAFQLVSLLRCSQLIASSRYHAVVTSMPGLVPSAGVTMDQRIRNLMKERGHEHLVVDADDPELGEKLVSILDQLMSDREAIAEAIARTVVKNLKAMAMMGECFEQDVRRFFPDFPRRLAGGWQDYLPQLGPELRSLAQRYDSASPHPDSVRATQ